MIKDYTDITNITDITGYSIESEELVSMRFT